MVESLLVDETSGSPWIRADFRKFLGSLTTSKNFFRARIDQMIELCHPLAVPAQCLLCTQATYYR